MPELGPRLVPYYLCSGQRDAKVVLAGYEEVRLGCALLSPATPYLLAIQRSRLVSGIKTSLHQHIEAIMEMLWVGPGC